MLLNGNFEDINTCSEYKAECGVEAWFYLKDVKVQMLSNEPNTAGANSFAIFYNWAGYTRFTPVIGTILPCKLQAGKQYTFKGWMTARLHSQLTLLPGVALGQNFYVPRRPFSKDMKPDSIMRMKAVPETPFYEFEYSFVATGEERYLTFGTFVAEDVTVANKRLFGAQTVSLILDNFSLTAADPLETSCAAYTQNRQNIYEYDYRHKDMDYTLYGKGQLPVPLSHDPKDNLTRLQAPPPPLKPDTLKLGDVLFDFNKAELNPGATTMLGAFFQNKEDNSTIDSIYIEGHTDSLGSDERNTLLSRQRSDAVMQWLEANNIVSPEKVTIHPFGRTRPVATNKTAAGRALNRRVEVVVFWRGGR